MKYGNQIWRERYCDSQFLIHLLCKRLCGIKKKVVKIITKNQKKSINNLCEIFVIQSISCHVVHKITNRINEKQRGI